MYTGSVGTNAVCLKYSSRATRARLSILTNGRLHAEKMTRDNTAMTTDSQYESIILFSNLRYST